MSDEKWCERSGSEIIPQQIFDDELVAIRARRKHLGLNPIGNPGDHKGPTTRLGLSGLAISGGGIRSATFSLGVMQALASKGALKHFDYLSTVSGGGYSGSQLTWALYAQSDNKEYRSLIESFDVGAGFPVGTDDPREPRPAKPAKERLALLRYLREHGKYLTPGGGIGALSGLGVLLRGIIDNLLLWFLLTATLILLLLNRFEWVFDTLKPFAYVALLGVLIGVVYSLGTFGLFGTRTTRYWLRRAFEVLAAPYFVVALLSLVIGTLDDVHFRVGRWVALLSPSMLLSGIGVGVWTYLQSGANRPHEAGTEATERKLPLGLIATIGSVLLIYGGLLGAYALAKRFSDGIDPQWAWIALVLLLAYGWFVNTNFLSLHRFYRDRLMETFLPEIGRAVEGKTGASYPANKAPISSMWNKDRPRGPYHIVNTNVVLVDSNLRKQRARGGENFILSPFYCGSDSTAWRRTEHFERDGLTLATAMAISGAAANPNAGVGGKGLTRNRLVSVLMALLNLRLGYWVRHPRKGRASWWPPNHFHPGLYEIYSGFKETKPWLQLSDGGHFENLALYELIRRRLKLIVVLDGGADPDFNYADLQTASRRIAEDFGARIIFPENEPGPGALAYDKKRTDGFPAFKGRADKDFLIAQIKYDEDQEGTLIYLKTTMVKDLSVVIEGYKDAHPTFPDQSTVDQFFDPEQFEAYRELGYVIGERAAAAILERAAP